ncbi:flagellar hook-length control protein FliK [Pseudooceanicola sp. 502str34]
MTKMMPEAAALRARNAEGGASGDGGALQAPDEMLLSVGPSSMAPEERGMSAPTREVQADLLHHPKAAVRQMAQQVAAAARSVVDTAVEVRMRPEELGHVRMAVHHMEGGVFLHITAERAETLVLMRRHADPLMKELQEEGYGDVRLLFDRQDGAGDSAGGRDRDTGQERTDGMRAPAAGPVAMDPAPPPAVNDPAVQAGLDLRL